MTDLESLYDKPKLLKISIESALLQATILDSVIPSQMTKKLLGELQFIQKQYPVSAQEFILGQLMLNGGSMGGSIYLQLGDTIIEITGKIHPNPVEEKAKKWYQF